MIADFDIAANNYDHHFSNSKIGILQRQTIYYQFNKYLRGINNVLEINCGTGEDAICLAKQNISVIATDISQKMIEEAKIKKTKNIQNINFSILDINKIETLKSNLKFDLAFSKFGGLNCLSKSQLELFFLKINSYLDEGGKISLVIMPKNTVCEQIYFTLKFRFKKVFRRKKGKALANVESNFIETFYYNPNDITSFSKDNFETLEVKPIGFFVPPSFLEPFFKNKIGLLKLLHNLDQLIKNWSFLSRFADHFIITLQKK